MRLSKIKLAGFKSFVDPTEIVLSSNLVAILGPNGCGKSNTIDAVRWVMGESSAKNLRSGSITDVIFSGSTTRKPVGQCSVELIFDNTDGTVGGEYAAYAEISIRRVVTRDGQSQYYLNGTKCRRKDITDIFLGTGLGPRSYAIIEQGMISRLIEAKPDDLRIFLEEAAGISKYKERRKETESRISHTRENLARLEDLQSELDKQLKHLQRQSEAARHYNDYKEQEKTLRSQLDAMCWQRLETEIVVLQEDIRQAGTLLASAQAQIQNAELEIEKKRQFQIESYDKHDAIQKEYYGLGTQIATVEQTILHHQERKDSVQEELGRVREGLSAALQNYKEDNDKIESLTAQFDALEPELVIVNEQMMLAQDKLSECEDILYDMREKLNHVSEQSMAPIQNAEIEKSKITQLENYIRKTNERTAALEKEKEGLNLDVLEKGIAENQAKITQAENSLLHIESELAQKSESIDAKKHDLESLQEKNNDLQSKAQIIGGRLASIEALQQAALSADNEQLENTLTEKGIAHLGSIAAQIDVSAGYELAVEVVLGHLLQAHCLNELSDLRSVNLSDNTLPLGSCFISQSTASVEGESAEGNLGLPPLSQFCHTNHIQPLLAGVYAANDVEQAWHLRTQLKAHESIICPCGTWFGANWLKLGNSTNDAQSGILQREKELKVLKADLVEIQASLDETLFALGTLKEEIKALEEVQFDLQKKRTEHDRELREYHNQLSNRTARFEQLQLRLEAIDKELSQSNAEYQAMQVDIAKARTALELALDQMSTFSEQKECLTDELRDFEDQIRTYRESAKIAKDKSHQFALKQQAIDTEKSAILSNLKRADDHIASFKNRETQLMETLYGFDDPILDITAQLEQLLENRVEIENRLTSAKQELNAVEATLREEEQRRQQATNEQDTFRNRLEKAKMDWQALSVRQQVVTAQMQEAEVDVQSVLANMPPEANESLWQSELDNLVNKIQRLGAINLAAIDEYGAALERKTYLDSQLLDLNEALSVLAEAIHTIDLETRLRFKDTYDIVNEHFKALFPRLFGGGQAYLELTGEDLLDTGVQVIARPPGKKNSSIQMLSGGEKALTAVAMVFSIFQLNPAPFCMLDEVDAPLDDTNVGRFCAMVKEMSKTVQFIFISHNKLTMEMADYLLGVTMREPGVSRLVSVNMEEAASLAEA